MDRFLKLDLLKHIDQVAVADAEGGKSLFAAEFCLNDGIVVDPVGRIALHLFCDIGNCHQWI